MTAPSPVARRDDLSRVALYRLMLTIRRFEEITLELRESEHIVGSLHLSCGQEAIPAGACAVLGPEDRVVATYRGHGWALACGVPPVELFAELCGRATGTNGGRGGAAFLTSPHHGFVGENSIIGAGVPIANGIAFALRARESGGVAVVSFGDGAMNQGATHEGLVLAGLRSLPVILVCENNGWSEMTPIGAMTRVPNLAARVDGYGMPAFVVDGNDPVVVAAVVADAHDRARRGDGPTFLECKTVRLYGHYNGDVEHYRSKENKEAAYAADPVGRLRGRLLVDGEMSLGELEDLERAVAEKLDNARADAIDAPFPDPQTASAHVVGSPRLQQSRVGTARTSTELTYSQAVNAALRRELEERSDVFVFGEDVAIPGGIFGVTRGLLDRFGERRVFDTPISESAILGLAVGSAFEGMRPVAEIMWADFLLVALDQLVNQAANIRYVNRGECSAPMVVRCQQGAAPGSCAQHSQSLEALLAHVPGLRVGLPATPHDAYAMLRAAIADDDPCVVIESRVLYQLRGPVDLDAPVELAAGASKVRDGSDLALLTWGRMRHDVLRAAEALAAEGIEASITDLRWVSPLDAAAIAEAVSRPGRVLVVHEANTTGGVGAEVVARISNDLFDLLDAPPARLGTPDVRMPAAPVLQAALIPDVASIVAAARDLVNA